MDGTIKKWKYLSFSLIGVLGFGFILPAASGAPVNIHDQIFEFVEEIKELTIDANDTIHEVKAKTDTIGAVKAIKIDRLTLDPSDGQSSSETILQFAAPFGSKSYSGHLTLTASHIGDLDHQNSIEIYCIVDLVIQTTTKVVTTADDDLFDLDFTCHHLTIFVRDNPGGDDASGSEIRGLVQYVETENITTVS